MSNKTYPIPLTVEQLLKKAQEIVGVDLVDADAVEPLTMLVRSFNEESVLREDGAISLQNRLLRTLTNRLRMQRDFAAHPEIAEQKITRPIFVAGYLRTGSTKVHRLFSASEDFNWLPLWKTLNSASSTGKPGEDVGPRIKDAEQYVADLYAGSPGASALHEQGALVAEEESYIFCQDLRCGGYLSYANVPSYLGWLATQDMAGTYRYLHDVLKYLQWQGLADPSKRWFLKSPFHWGQEDMLLASFPDASIIYTHRPPTELLPSMCSLMAGYMRWHTDNVDVDGRMVLGGFAFNLSRHFAFRNANPGFSLLDVDYREATQDVESVIRRVYAFLDLPLSEESLQRMLRWNRDNPINKHGAHRYAAEDFGLSEQAIVEQCRDYLDFYNTRFPS